MYITTISRTLDDKENVDTNSNVIVSSETTLNLWKYIVPPHPGELEEDSFIVDNMVCI